MKINLLLTILTLVSIIQVHSQSVLNTYNAGDIPTNSSSYSSSCNGPVTPLTVALPAGGSWDVTAIDVVYNMTAASGAWKSEQRSKIYCQNTTTGEASYSSGSGGTGGTQGYNRTGITIANGNYAGSTVLTFEMQAYRTWAGSAGCSTTYNKIDDGTWTITVYYSTPPTCPDPSSLTATSIMATQADLGWTEIGSATIWDIELGTSGFLPTGTPTQSSVTNPYTYTGLSASSSYDFYVRSDCGGGDLSSWIGPFNFSTNCGSISSFPYCESFEGTTEDCWTVNNNNADGDLWNMDYTTSPRTGSHVAIIYTDYNSGNNDDYLITPPINLTSNQELKYWYRVQSSGEPNDFEVLLSTTGNNAGDFTTTLLTNTSYSNTTYQEEGINLNAYSGTVYIAFHVPNGGLDGWRLYIDDVCIENLPTCPDPSVLTATSIAATQADLGWTENGSATLWDIELGTVGFSPTGTPTQNDVTSNPYTYTGLTQSTSYDFYVRADCGGSDFSNWIGPFNFTTTISCPAPSTLTATGITTTTVDLGWTENGISGTWDIEFGTDGFSPTGTPTYYDATANPYEVSSLTPNTSYDFYVRSDCGIGDQSTWTGPFGFTTDILTGLVYISATGGTPNATYNTLKEAFDKVNDGTHQDIITIEIGASDGETVTETASASLNKSGVGAASYSSVLVNPGAANIKLVSSVAGSCCVPSGTITLNEAENVTIDGRVGSTGSTIDLTIENTTTGSWGSAFVFKAACNNVLKYCMLKSGNTASSGIGTVSFSDNNAGGGRGSSYNLMEECQLTKSGNNMPRHAIGGDGASGRENVKNSIKNCTIYNFEEYGIFLGSSSSSEGYNRRWIIDGNKFYQPSSFTNMLKNQAAICIGYPYSSSSSGKQENGTFTIKNNIIGGNGSGGDWSWSTSNLYNFFGIYVYSTYSSDSTRTKIDGNIIKQLNIESGNTTTTESKPVFSAIKAYNCRVFIGNTTGNIIGSDSQDNSIKFSRTAAGGWVQIISVTSNSDHGNRIMNNTISGIDVTTGTNNLSSFYGIHNNCSTTNTSDSISQNNISYLTLTKCNYFRGISANGFICKNRIRDIDFNGAASFSEMTGIHWYGGDVVGRGVENNEIIFGLNKSGTSVAVNDLIKGIVLNRDCQIYYNSVLIQGTASSSDNSICIELSSVTGHIFKNNLMYNERSGGSGKHYAVYCNFSTPAWWDSSNNAYVADGSMKSTNVLGYWGGDIATLATWESSTGESNSIADTPAGKPTATLFPLLSSDCLDVDDPSWLEAGTPVVEIIDIQDDSRDASVPTIGAYEKGVILILPVEMRSFEATCDGNKTILYWSTVSEINNNYFTVERSIDGKNFMTLGEVASVGNSRQQQNYSFHDIDQVSDLCYYRLKQTDNNGEYSYKEMITSKCENHYPVIIYPNPIMDELNIRLPNPSNGMVEIMLNDCLGRIVLRRNLLFNGDEIKISMDNGLPNGSYIISIKTEVNYFIERIVKYNTY